MQSKEVKKWQDEEALKRYQMIAPLLDEDLDEAKRRQLREEIAARYEISKRSLYQKVDQFIAEARVAKVHSLEELNQKWKYFLEQDYQKEAHDGIREYYESQGVKVPAEGISPMQEFNRDTRGLIFLDTTMVSEAFLHHEKRRLDNAGCFSFGDVKYEASTALANAEVEIAYDPMNTETIKVLYQDMKPIAAHRVRIGAFCDKTPDVPVGMTDQVPEISRFLDALEKKYREDHQLMADALCFGDYGKAGGSHV